MGNTSRNERTGTGGFVRISEVVEVVLYEIGHPDSPAKQRGREILRGQRGREILAQARERIRTLKLDRQREGAYWPRKGRQWR